MSADVERVTDLALTVYGPRFAVSLDPDEGGWKARVWNEKGVEVLVTSVRANRTDAVAELARKIREQGSR